ARSSLRLHSLPTRRSSDLDEDPLVAGVLDPEPPPVELLVDELDELEPESLPEPDDPDVDASDLDPSALEPSPLDEPDRDPESFRSEEHTSELQSRENLVCR